MLSTILLSILRDGHSFFQYSDFVSRSIHVAGESDKKMTRVQSTVSRTVLIDVNTE